MCHWFSKKTRTLFRKGTYGRSFPVWHFFPVNILPTSILRSGAEKVQQTCVTSHEPVFYFFSAPLCSKRRMKNRVAVFSTIFWYSATSGIIRWYSTLARNASCGKSKPRHSLIIHSSLFAKKNYDITQPKAARTKRSFIRPWTTNITRKLANAR